MPSPFPGVDPFIEGGRWPDFRHELIAVIREMLVPAVRPRYVVGVEQYDYLQVEVSADSRRIRPDLFLSESETGQHQTHGRSASAVLAEPCEIALPVMEEV